MKLADEARAVFAQAEDPEIVAARMKRAAIREMVARARTDAKKSFEHHRQTVLRAAAQKERFLSISIPDDNRLSLYAPWIHYRHAFGRALRALFRKEGFEASLRTERSSCSSEAGSERNDYLEIRW